jgi:hypothetical protein
VNILRLDMGSVIGVFIAGKINVFKIIIKTMNKKDVERLKKLDHKVWNLIRLRDRSGRMWGKYCEDLRKTFILIEKIKNEKS